MKGDVHGKGGCMHGKGRVCIVRGACVAGGRVCMARGCMTGGVHGVGGMCGRRDGHCSGLYASYWNAFLLLLHCILGIISCVFADKTYEAIRTREGHFTPRFGSGGQSKRLVPEADTSRTGQTEVHWERFLPKCKDSRFCSRRAKAKVVSIKDNCSTLGNFAGRIHSTKILKRSSRVVRSKLQMLNILIIYLLVGYVIGSEPRTNKLPNDKNI